MSSDGGGSGFGLGCGRPNFASAASITIRIAGLYFAYCVRNQRMKAVTLRLRWPLGLALVLVLA